MAKKYCFNILICLTTAGALALLGVIGSNATGEISEFLKSSSPGWGEHSSFESGLATLEESFNEALWAMGRH